MKLEFSSSLSLSNDDSERHQFVYATQLYGTLFGVYGKFKCQHQGDQVVLDEIEFIGINYKGASNISLYPQFDKPTYATDSNTGLRVMELNIYLQAGQEVTQNLNPLTLNFKEEFPEDTFTLKKGEYLRIQRKLVPMVSDNSLPLIEKAFYQGLFDSEFYERDGLYVREKSQDANDLNSGDLLFDNVKDNPLIDGDSERGALASIRCTPSNLKIYI